MVEEDEGDDVAEAVLGTVRGPQGRAGLGLVFGVGRARFLCRRRVSGRGFEIVAACAEIKLRTPHAIDARFASIPASARWRGGSQRSPRLPNSLFDVHTGVDEKSLPRSCRSRDCWC